MRWGAIHGGDFSSPPFGYYFGLGHGRLTPKTRMDWNEKGVQAMATSESGTYVSDCERKAEQN
ncbi:hypothetical protein Lal_00029843 [Lupinus albus]|nr:hypothetical protein Lal_00029843 [Lupinus albus]